MGDFFSILQFVLSETKAILSTGMLLTLATKGMDLKADNDMDVHLPRMMTAFIVIAFGGLLLSEEYIHMLNFRQTPQRRYLFVRLGTDFLGLVGVCCWMYMNSCSDNNKSRVDDWYKYNRILVEGTNKYWMYEEGSSVWSLVEGRKVSWTEFLIRNHGTYIPLLAAILKNLFLCLFSYI